MMSRITLNIRRSMDISDVSTVSLATIPITLCPNTHGGEVHEDIINISSSRAAGAEASEDTEGYGAGPMALL